MLPRDLASLPESVKTALSEAQSLIGIQEEPTGSNRGPDVDALNLEFGSPLGSYWCANFVGHCRKKGGLWIPSHSVGSTDEWLKQAKAAGKFKTSDPQPGDAVLYGVNGDPNHIGLVLMKAPVLQSIEGNTNTGAFERNGYTVALKEVNKARVIGYVSP